VRRLRPAASVLTLVVAALAVFAPADGRASVEDEGTFWTAYMSTWWLDESWGVWFDTHYDVDRFFALRGGLSRRFESGVTLTGGFAWLRLRPDLERDEYRPWGQILVPFRFDENWSASGRLRVGGRFLERLDGGEIVDGYDFVFRTRFQVALTRRFAPLSIGRPLVQIADEVLLNAASTTAFDVFDQNRISLLFGLEMKDVTVRVGYMHRYLSGGAGGRGVSEHTALLWFSQSVELRGARGAPQEEPDTSMP